MMLERQREGIARPKARLSDGISSTEVAKRLKIERGGVYRAMRLRNIKRQPTSIGGRPSHSLFLPADRLRTVVSSKSQPEHCPSCGPASFPM